MRKILSLLLAGMLLLGAGVSYAATSITLIDDTFAVADNHTIQTSSIIDTRNFKKMSFYINYDEVETTGVQGTFYVQVSWDKSTWFDVPIWTTTFRTDQQDTPDTKIVFTADRKEVAFFDIELVAPWVRVRFLPAIGDGDYIYITVEFIGIQ